MIEKGSKWWNNGSINKVSKICPGEEFKEGRFNFIPWSKGKIGIVSKETRNKISKTRREKGHKPVYSFPKGNIPWSKGKTANTDIRIDQSRNKQIGQKRTGNYKPKYHWQGEGNPWFGKSRSKENSPRYRGEHHKREYKDYYNKVRFLTEQTYKQYKHIINPNDYPRMLCGEEGGYQLDHIISIINGFENNILPEEIAKLENLQLLSWEENRKKWH